MSFPDLYKTRRCKAIIAQAPCSLGEYCTFAHTPSELRAWPWPTEVAEHWKGQVSVGVVEHAMFWDLPPSGTTDVVCNRSTVLGNPFGACSYASEGERAKLAPADEQGWRVQEHEVLVGAFDRYLQVVLDTTSSKPLEEEVLRIAEEQSLQLSEAWLQYRPARAQVLKALESLASRVRGGQRLRLLCHCRPHVRCHAESLKRYLDQFALESASPSSPSRDRHDRSTAHGVPTDLNGCLWPGTVPHAERCSVQTKQYVCQRDQRALDPETMKGYCAQCWSHHSRVYRWPAFEDSWPTECYFEDYVPKWNTNGSAICWYYQNGCCKFGDSCPFSHVSKGG